MLTQILVRIIMAGIVGMAVGIVTSRTTARLFSIICMGAALLTLISTEYFKVLNDPWFSDPGRLSAQMVSALGFLGTGLIWVSEKNEVQGLSVAASLWVTAILGMLVGAGLENVSAAAVFIVIIIYVFSGFIKKRFLIIGVAADKISGAQDMKNPGFNPDSASRLQYGLILLGNISFRYFYSLGNHVTTVSGTHRTPSLGGNYLVNP